MADKATLQTLDPFSTKPREKLVPVGGKMGFWDEFEQTVELVARGEGSFVNEEPVSRFPSSGEITGFQNASAVEKSDEELISEQRAAVAEVESILNTSRTSRVEFVAKEEIRLELEGMSEEDRNKRLKLNINFRKKNTEDAYHMAELYRQLKNEQKQINQQEEAIQKQEVEQFTMGEGELFKGIEKSGGGHFTTTPG